MKTVYPESKASQLELALDYKQPALIRQFAREALNEQLKKEAQVCMIDYTLREYSFLYQQSPKIEIQVNGSISVWQGGFTLFADVITIIQENGYTVL